MDGNSCFVCGNDCSSSTLMLINLETKKYKTRYTVLIGNLINSEYELRIAKSDKICEKCSILIEKYDELQYETKTVKSVLSRQIAITYSIETDEDLIYLDKSKIFAELRANGNDQSTKYSCKLCQNFVTTCIDTVNAHIMYHKIIDEQKNTISNVIKEVKAPSTSKSRAQQSAREVQKVPEKTKSTSLVVNSIINNINQEPVQVVKQPAAVQYQLNSVQEYEEEALDSLIDLNLLEDENYDSNLSDHKCAYDDCPEVFTYACDYVRHLRLKHKSSLNNIFSALKSNLKRPKKLSSLMCPYCFTKTASAEQLENHVKQHEEAATKSSLLTDRIGDFVGTLMQACRCTVCDCEILDPTALECNHEIVKNGMAPRLNCESCDRYFYSEKLYNNHLALDHGQCFCCGSSFKDASVLKSHIRSHLGHSEYACEFCKDIYQTNKNRLEHIKWKHPNHCCNHCEEWYKNTSDLEHHVRYAHADKRSKQKASICDNCGATFKSKHLYERHLQQDHRTKKIFKCSTCKTDFRYRYMLMDHVASAHNRTIIDNEVNFYKCCFCMKGFSSQNRKSFVEHLDVHQSHTSYCYDCNSNLNTVTALQTHRERIHQDFSKTVDKYVIEIPKAQANAQQNNTKTTYKLVNQDNKVIENPDLPTQQMRKNSNTKQRFSVEVASPQIQQNVQVTAPNKQQYEIINSLQPETQQQQPQSQQIMIQNEDGTFLNMNNLILTENGELIIQNLDGLLQNGQENDEGGQIQISNLEQFLLEQGLSSNAEISYIQEDMINDSQVVIQNDDGTTQDSALMQTYKEIFEPDDEITAELTADAQQIEHQTQNILLNGEYVLQTPSTQQLVKPSNNNTILQTTIEHVDVGNSQPLDAANQSTLDELGDILLEVAAAAEKEKKPKATAQNQHAIRENLWGKKRQLENIRENNPKRRSTKQLEIPPEAETPARNFSQAYELFVRGFDAKKQKQL